MMSLENLNYPCCYEVNFSLPLLVPGNIFPQNKAVSSILLENMHCPCYNELKCLHFMSSIENLSCSYYRKVKVWQK